MLCGVTFIHDTDANCFIAISEITTSLDSNGGSI